jgi:hypothetical protein
MNSFAGDERVQEIVRKMLQSSAKTMWKKPKKWRRRNHPQTSIVNPEASSNTRERS